MADAGAQPGASLGADLALAWQAIGDATVDVEPRKCAWRWWKNYTASNGISDPYLQDRDQLEQLGILLAFAACIRSGRMGRGKQVKKGSVSSALRYVGQTFELAGYPDPRLIPSNGKLKLAVTRLYKRYDIEDPAVQSQIALPVEVFQDILQNAAPDAFNQQVAHLIVMAFFCNCTIKAL